MYIHKFKRIASKVAPNLSLIKAGDLILTRTSSRLYNILRALTSESFDHIAVVLNDKLVLHIGPGRIRTLSLIRLLEPKRSPIVLRPILSAEEKDQFLLKCKSMIGGSYDLVRIFDFVLRLILLNWTRIKIPFKKVRVDLSEKRVESDHKHKQWLCSDAIMNALICTHPKYKDFLMDDLNSGHNQKEIMLNNLGSLTIEDFMTMANQSDALFERIELPLQYQPKASSTLPVDIVGYVRKYMNMLNELTAIQKVLLVVLIAYIFDIVFLDKSNKKECVRTNVLNSKL